jgi:flagellar hook-associated protein 3 FlgL
MSLRITQGMLYSRALNDVQSGLFRYSQLQQQVATGRRVNRASDDPAAALRILPLRNDLRNLGQLGSNVALARETLNTGSASLEDASAAMQRVRELTTQAANGTLSAQDRSSIGAEVEQLLNQIVGIANSKRGDRYLFGGTENGSAPFELITEGGRTRAVYHGNRESLDVEVAPGIRTELNVPGDRIFMARDRGATTFSAAEGSAPTGATPAGRGDSAVGFAALTIGFAGLHTDAPSTVTAGNGTTNALGELDYVFTTGPDTLSIGGGPALAIPVTNGAFTTADGRSISLTVSGAATPATGTFTAKANLSTDGGASFVEVADFAAASVAVRDSFGGGVLNVDVRNLNRTGTEDVKYEGTFDALTTLITMRDLLRNDAGLPDQVVRDRVAQMMGEVESAHDAVLDGLRELGFRSSSMDVLGNRVESLKVARSESLSLVEDADMAESILQLQRQDLAYQAALQVSAKVVQTSLQGFLR